MLTGDRCLESVNLLLTELIKIKLAQDAYMINDKIIMFLNEDL